MLWNAVGFAIVTILLVACIVMLVRIMGRPDGTDANARIEAAAGRVERACAAQARHTEASRIALAPRRQNLWREPGAEDLDDGEEISGVCHEGPDSSDAIEIRAREAASIPDAPRPVRDTLAT